MVLEGVDHECGERGEGEARTGQEGWLKRRGSHRRPHGWREAASDWSYEGRI